MTQITDEQNQQLEAAATSMVAKLDSFQAGLSPEERFLLGAALEKAGAQTHGAPDDAAGYRSSLDIALSSVERLPIWGSLETLVGNLTTPINWAGAFSGVSVYHP